MIYYSQILNASNLIRLSAGDQPLRSVFTIQRLFFAEPTGTLVIRSPLSASAQLTPANLSDLVSIPLDFKLMPACKYSTSDPEVTLQG